MVKKNDKKSKTTTKLNEKNPPKKRGRKPKGGKIITNIIKDKDVDNETKSNIILHLNIKILLYIFNIGCIAYHRILILKSKTIH